MIDGAERGMHPETKVYKRSLEDYGFEFRVVAAVEERKLGMSALLRPCESSVACDVRDAGGRAMQLCPYRTMHNAHLLGRHRCL